jgi:hypothetical protein
MEIIGNLRIMGDALVLLNPKKGKQSTKFDSRGPNENKDKIAVYDGN